MKLIKLKVADAVTEWQNLRGNTYFKDVVRKLKLERKYDVSYVFTDTPDRDKIGSWLEHWSKETGSIYKQNGRKGDRVYCKVTDPLMKMMEDVGLR